MCQLFGLWQSDSRGHGRQGQSRYRINAWALDFGTELSYFHVLGIIYHSNSPGNIDVGIDSSVPRLTFLYP